MPNDNNQNMFNNPLVSLLLMVAASVPDPQGKLNSLGQAINSMRDAVNSINAGLETFHTQVMPMIMRQPEKK
ncbi:hypothetical protein SAMN05660649_03580 [Desulfotomaculum arcticum]|uniref:Uncharacterized protein n=1 Tax=Desulfotruncus arcticus DSM 17038 TaxID=1121424 RepID=A0A1I2WPE0_9FIRM|nr:hypothetical protein [Desulfotruncus arcticus]SFH03250.1 hypothetical protein SAMN05660649_03580 [Desulfotomaculum arcticum] [Desulfotruncus arcticus DSM 17038]